jgi:hypothetical protein
MVLPFLVLIATVGWHAAQTGFFRVAVASEARQKAWAKRDRCDPGVPFDLRQPPLVSYHQEKTEADVPRKSPISGETQVAKAETGVTDKTHDYHDDEFPFPELASPGGRVGGGVARTVPHVKQIKMFGRFIPFVGRHASDLEGFAQMDPRCNPKLVQYRGEGEAWAPRRAAALNTIGNNLPSMIAAAVELRLLELAAIADLNFPLAAKYDREADVVERGIPAAAWLLGKAVTD